ARPVAALRAIDASDKADFVADPCTRFDAHRPHATVDWLCGALPARAPLEAKAELRRAHVADVWVTRMRQPVGLEALLLRLRFRLRWRLRLLQRLRFWLRAYLRRCGSAH